MANYLVTGGAGFIGSNIVDRLVELGHTVRVLDDFSSGHHKNLDQAADRIDLIEGTICDFDTCRSACRDVEIVLHQAAVPSVPKSMADPVTSHKANVDGIFNMLLASRDAGVRRFVMAASSSSYGETPELPKRETMPVCPISPYGANKAIGEIYCYAFYKSFGLQTLALRYFNVFGPRQDPNSQYAAAIPAFLAHMLKGEPPIVFGDGEQSRDFSYIENVIQANIKAAEATETHGEVVNIACGAQVTVNQVIGRMNELLGADIEPTYEPERPGDIKHSWADVSLAREVIGFEPVVQFDEGLQQAFQWYKENL
jgi:UDP-N-acetylglucosamine/UDP-N-acetyl-alpha-D-glucosaminouronate 4-epimerase